MRRQPGLSRPARVENYAACRPQTLLELLKA